MLRPSSSRIASRYLIARSSHARRAFRSSSSYSDNDNDNYKNTTKIKPSPLAVSLFKNPIVHQLWTARQEAKQRKGTAGQAAGSLDPDGNTTPSLPQPKSPADSRVAISYPFTTDELLLESYRNPWGQMRFGRIIEDLDALAGNIAFFHVDDSDRPEANHPIIVTASVDRICLHQRPAVGVDQYLSGQVTWTGTSSMEIRMQCSSSPNIGDGLEWLEAFVTFVTLDPVTKKPTAIPAIQPTTPHEHALEKVGAARAAVKKKRRQQHTVHVHQSNNNNNEAIDKLAADLLTEAGPLLNMPSLADPHSILMQATKMQNAMIAQPQAQNMHKRIFGGFLMRRGFELAFSNAYVFGGARPLFLEVDDVSFASPVDVGDLLVFNSRVLYTDTGKLRDYYTQMKDSDASTMCTDREVPIVHVEVEAWVTEPEKASARLSNQFYFTFAINVDAAEKNVPVRRVLPSNIDEARRMAIRILVDREQNEE